MESAAVWSRDREKNPLCSDPLQDEEKKKQARALFEESAHQGCLASSYLLWESDRRVDVSGWLWKGRDRVSQRHSLDTALGPGLMFLASGESAVSNSQLPLSLGVSTARYLLWVLGHLRTH